MTSFTEKYHTGFRAEYKRTKLFIPAVTNLPQNLFAVTKLLIGSLSNNDGEAEDDAK